MLLFENKKSVLINFLSMGINPFIKFVSTGELKEELGLVKSRKNILESIIKIIENKKNFILPIIGEIGIGKTHLYWALKNELYYFNTIYISLEKASKRFFYNIYSKFIKTIEADPLKNIINNLCNEWGALERKYGFFHVADIEKVKKNAFNRIQHKYRENEKTALLDIISGITTHQLDPYKKREAERWLLGELMNVKELSRLNLMYDLRKSKNAFVMLKLLIENSKLGTVLFIDDFEKVISTPRQIEEDEGEVFDRSWLFGKKQTPDDFTTQKVLEKIIKLQRIEDLRIIIVLNSTNSLEQIKRKIKKVKDPLTMEFLEPIQLEKFTEDDVFEFYEENMERFLQNFKYSDFYEDFPGSYFPLNKNLLKMIYHKTKGNPRDISKFLSNIFNEIIFSQEKLEDVLKEYQI